MLYLKLPQIYKKLLENITALAIVVLVWTFLIWSLLDSVSLLKSSFEELAERIYRPY